MNMRRIQILRMRYQVGLSLVELLVAMAVGVLLTSGILQVLTNSTQAYRVQNSIARVQENGQFAMEFLAKDIRGTDFWGCLRNLDNVSNRLDPAGPGYTTPLFGFGEGIDGTENSPGGTTVAGTDSVTVRGSINVAGGLSLQPPYGPTVAAPITVGSNSGIQSGDLVLVSDCLQGDLFQVTSIDGAGTIGHAAGSGSPGNISGDLSKIYTGNSFVYLPYSHTYDIRTGGNGQPALFRTDENGSVELIEGVEDMIVLFGEDTSGDGTANRYVQANSVTDMNEVVSVRIHLLMQSQEDNVADGPQAYLFNGQSFTPADNRIRRTYSSTIVLRNRSGES